jgi:hypothetical protein
MLGSIKIRLLQAALQTSHRHTCRGVGVHHAMRSGQAFVHRSMHCETRRVDRVGRTIEHAAMHIDLDQVAGRDLAVVQAKGVDQEVFLAPRDAVG